MKLIKFVLPIIFIINTAYAQNVQQGEVISANEFNSAGFAIGSYQHSSLTKEQFRVVSGDCWRLLDGTSIAGSDLAILTGNSTLADITSEGQFLRQATASRALGSIEGDAIRNIVGSHMDGNRSPIYETTAGNTGAFGPGPYRSGYTCSTATNNYSGWPLTFDASRVVPTAAENRPKNIAVNIFIKINKKCNFD